MLLLPTRVSEKKSQVHGGGKAARRHLAPEAKPAGEMDSVGNLKGRGPTPRSPNFEVIDGLLYRKKLEKGFINYREVLHEDRRHEAISTFHRRRPGLRHLSLEETYKCVAENYWWEGRNIIACMYFQIRDFVLGCPDPTRTYGWVAQESSHTLYSSLTMSPSFSVPFPLSLPVPQDPGGGGRVSKTMTSHGDYMLSKLRSQREAGLFCDITLRTDGRSYSAHRAVLAAVSEYFQEIFTEMDSSTKTDVDLTGRTQGRCLDTNCNFAA
uniref:BTB domain-containing protein n=1 Tax=Myripristis murdjan TaxID=586833 RepID=A0A667WWP7_9TELE